MAASTYCFVAAPKLVTGSALSINAPVIVPPAKDNLVLILVVISVIKLALLPIAAANSFNVSNTKGAPLIKLLIELLT